MVSCIGQKNNRIEYCESYGFGVHKQYSPILSKYLKIAAKNKKILLKGTHYTTGGHSDTLPFRLRKYDAIDVATYAALLYAHTVKDVPEKVDVKVLLDTCNLIRETLKLIDDDYHLIYENQEVRSVF
jgi:hypothetical protein